MVERKRVYIWEPLIGAYLADNHNLIAYYYTNLLDCIKDKGRCSKLITAIRSQTPWALTKDKRRNLKNDRKKETHSNLL